MADDSNDFAVLLEFVEVSFNALDSCLVLPTRRRLGESLLLGCVPLSREAHHQWRGEDMRVCARKPKLFSNDCMSGVLELVQEQKLLNYDAMNI